jgi:hypothetical protein
MSENKYVAAIKYSADRIDTGVMLASDLETIQIVRMNTSMIRADTDALAAQLAEAEALGEVVANDRLICGERLAEAEARVHELEQRIREAMVAASEIQLFDVGYPEQGWVEFDVESWLEDYLHPGDLPDTDGGTT